MSTHNAILISGVASEDIAKGQFVKYESGGWDACDTAGEHADGVAFNDAAAGEALTIQTGGLVLYKVGASQIADGAKITTTTGGLGVTATSGDYVRLKAHGVGEPGAYAQALWFDGWIYDGT